MHKNGGAAVKRFTIDRMRISQKALALLSLVIATVPAFAQQSSETKKTVIMNGCSEPEASASRLISWDDYIKSAVEAADRGDYASSEKMFRGSLDIATINKNDVQIAKSLENLAWAYKRLSDNMQAEEIYKKLVDQLRKNAANPKMLQAYNSAQQELTYQSFELAKLYRSEGKYAEAAPLYEEYLSTEPSACNVGFLTDYASVLTHLGRTREAQALKDEMAWMSAGSDKRQKTHQQYVPRDSYYRTADSYRTAVGMQIRNMAFYRAEKHTTVVFTIRRDGSLANLRITAGSGSAASDQGALRAIQDAGPFPPLPDAIEDELDMTFVLPGATYPLKPL